jgi:hypothetical protein
MGFENRNERLQNDKLNEEYLNIIRNKLMAITVNEYESKLQG